MDSGLHYEFTPSCLSIEELFIQLQFHKYYILSQAFSCFTYRIVCLKIRYIFISTDSISVFITWYAKQKEKKKFQATVNQCVIYSASVSKYRRVISNHTRAAPPVLPHQEIEGFLRISFSPPQYFGGAVNK